MAKSGKSKKKSKAVTVSMKGVDSGGRSIKDGWAVGKVVEAELTEAKESGNEMFKIVIEARNGKQKAKVWDNLVLTPNALWKMRSLFEAAGVEIDEEEDMKITADDLLDLEEFDVEIVNEEYENRMRPKVSAFAPLGTHTDDEGDDDEEEDEDEDDEEEKPSKKSKKKSSKSDDDEDEDEDDEDDEEDDDSDDDDEEEDDEDEDEPPAKSKKKSKKKPVEDDDEDDEDDSSDDDDEDEDEADEDDEDEDEDDEPKKKGKKSKAKLRAGQKVKFEDDKGRTKSGVITSVDDDTVFVEDAKGEEWELSTDEIL